VASQRQSTRAGDDDNRNCRADVARDQDCHCGRAERKIHQIARQPVRQSLRRSARLLSTLDGLNDLAKARVAPNTFDFYFKGPGLINRTGKDHGARGFFDRQRLARDARLVEIRMTAQHAAVDRDAAAWADENGIADTQFVRLNVANRSLAPHRDRSRQEIQKILDRAPAPGHRHTLKHLGDKNEQADDERREELPDRGRGNNGDGHRQFHRHAAGKNILDRLLENRPATKHQADHADRADPC
jgi:hypothetical protein